MQELKLFNYEGTQVSFLNKDGNLFLNATEMAKAFGKSPADYLRRTSTKEFIDAYIKENPVMGNPITVSQGGTAQGTWMLEDVALDFAQWLSPSFRVWINARIKELMKHGATALNPEDLLNPDFIINLATALKAERSAKELAQQQVAAQTAQLQLSAPKVQYYDEVLQSESLIPVTLIAKELGMSASTLNRKLHEKRVIYKMGETWVLYDKYQNSGYTKPKTVHYTSSTGEPKTTIHTYWTEAGRCFIHQLIQK